MGEALAGRREALPADGTICEGILLVSVVRTDAEVAVLVASSVVRQAYISIEAFGADRVLEVAQKIHLAFVASGRPLWEPVLIGPIDGTHERITLSHDAFSRQIRSTHLSYRDYCARVAQRCAYSKGVRSREG